MRVMTVIELIGRLQVCKDPEKDIRILVDWENRPIVNNVAYNEDHVLLGNDLPAEAYETDYKYER